MYYDFLWIAFMAPCSAELMIWNPWCHKSLCTLPSVKICPYYKSSLSVLSQNAFKFIARSKGLLSHSQTGLGSSGVFTWLGKMLIPLIPAVHAFQGLGFANSLFSKVNFCASQLKQSDLNTESHSKEIVSVQWECNWVCFFSCHIIWQYLI